ncbi:MAG: S-adenosylmethionine decarboxylase [Bacteroidales bacterium]|jgi:S-adenosylmethionine/arginine decarboxylase-like enzyme|nr:S-adenosylmethionine decarboxylase [Bacteroidales bacterium]
MQAKIWNHSGWIQETNPLRIRECFNELLRGSGFNVLQSLEHYFHPQGYTCLWLLSESHFAAHTFPELERTYIELSSCNLEYYQKFIELTKEL